MKKVIICLFIICFAQSCKSQNIKKSLNEKDVRVFKFIDKNVFVNSEYIHDGGKFILNQEKNIIPLPKVYTFYKKKDTMEIKCFCNYENNIYIDSIKFSKGKFEINIIKFLRKSTPQKLDKVLISGLNKYKDLYFYQINFNDTTNIYVKKN